MQHINELHYDSQKLDILDTIQYENSNGKAYDIIIRIKMEKVFDLITTRLKLVWTEAIEFFL